MTQKQTRCHKNKMIQLCAHMQEKICHYLSISNQTPLIKDQWRRPSGGGGLTCIIPEGKLLEKGGVNTSTIYGELQPQMIDTLKLKDLPKKSLEMFACGISLVLHPLSPFIPTVHANYRFFEIYQNKKPLQWWFGGGADLTPYYLFEEDVQHFHTVHKEVCDEYDPQFYPLFKKACDAYFYLPHRKEHRGVGGIFFLKQSHKDQSFLFQWVRDCLGSFLSAYTPIVEKRKHMKASSHHRQWQLLRRGRYVEFNLLYDVGTRFGLRSEGRVESILMTLPKNVIWEYDHKVKKNTWEEKLMKVLKKPRQWAL